MSQKIVDYHELIQTVWALQILIKNKSRCRGFSLSSPLSEKYIFGRFDSFCLRLKNLLEMFCLINKFTELFRFSQFISYLEHCKKGAKIKVMSSKLNGITMKINFKF